MKRDSFLQHVGWTGAGIAFTLGSSGLFAPQAAGARTRDFSFVQISDSHIGFHQPANSDVAATTGVGVSSADDSVQMAANDSLSIGAGVTVNVALGLGDDYLANFASTDVLNLAADFTSVNDLLAHTGLNHLGQTTIQLDTNGDTQSLGISKTALATYANDGLVKFS